MALSLSAAFVGKVLALLGLIRKRLEKAFSDPLCQREIQSRLACQQVREISPSPILS